VGAGNTDDHLRNHAFLRRGRGWALSPAYDLNPNPNRPDRLSTAIDLDDTKADLETVQSVSGYFRLTLAEARSEIASVRDATSRWRNEAADLNLPQREMDLMAGAFETDQRRAANNTGP
jgi:serine/threonine-protein kinase HipA